MLKKSENSPPCARAAVEISKEIRAGEVVLCAKLSGTWHISEGLSTAEALYAQLRALTPDERATVLEFDCTALRQYDSSLICYIIRCAFVCAERGIKISLETLPENVRKLFQIAKKKRGQPLEHRHARDKSLLYNIGKWGEKSFVSWEKGIGFLGETGIAIVKFFRGKARFRWRDCAYFIQNCGTDALPIITLISFITGMILAYIGAMQLQRFGTIIYVANLIALAMVREMGVLMSSVIMCGRTGSAFAAQIGSMQASEEISALRVLGINPVEYLVLPRLIALTLMMPLLTAYSNAIGMLGGLFVMGSMDVTLEQYWNQIVLTLNPSHVMSGLIKSVFFGFMVAWAGCYRGMFAGKSSLDVGEAATSAAVLGMVLIVIGDGIFAVLFNALGF